MLCVLTQLCPTLCGPTDCSPPDSSVQGVFQARILEWVAPSYSRKSSWPRDQNPTPSPPPFHLLHRQVDSFPIYVITEHQVELYCSFPPAKNGVSFQVPCKAEPNTLLGSVIPGWPEWGWAFPAVNQLHPKAMSPSLKWPSERPCCQEGKVGREFICWPLSPLVQVCPAFPG